MLDRFKRIDIADPGSINVAMWETLSPNERSLSNYQSSLLRTYQPADRRTFRADPQSYLSSIAVTHLGALRLASIVDRRGTTFIIETPGMGAYCLCLIKRGSVGLCSPVARPGAAAGENTGLIYAGLPNTNFTSSDDNERLTIWIPANKLKSCLETLADRFIADDLVFTPAFALNTGIGASIRELSAYIEQELSRPDSLLSGRIGTDLIEDLLCRYVVQGVPHNHSHWLRQPQAVAGRHNVRRAEDYLRAHLTDSVTLTDLARVAGCSVRSLQMAFQEARGTTPMAALRQARLEQARQMLRREDPGTSVIDVALRFGFNNPGRFAQLYQQAFGERPLRTLRGRGK